MTRDRAPQRARQPAFEALWRAGGIYFIANAMQTMAAAWMMVELTGSSFLAAAVQTAVFLPMFLLSLPAGVLADTADRRTLLLGSLWVQAASGAVLAALLLAGIGGPGTVLFFIFLGGCCTALLTPAWNSAVAETVGRDELPQAITTVSIAYNAARALGPTLAGVVSALAGSPWNFVLAVAGTLTMAQAIRRHPPRPHPPSRLPPERLWGGMASALRYAWHSQPIRAQLVRTVAYSFSGSALWALLPVVGARQLGLGAAGVGLLVGCMGAGAVAAGLVLRRVRDRLGLEWLVTLGCAVFAAAMAIAAHVARAWAVYPALALAGAAWMSVMTTFNTATQTSAPPWVRARAVAMHTLCSLGSFAIGSALWGALSDIAGLPAALTAAAAGMAASIALARPFPLRMGRASEVTPASLLDDFQVAHEPPPEAGPVAVEIAYRVRPGQAEAFLDALSLLRGPRKRDGATFWRIYRDLSDPSRFVERFIVSSWADYLHQRARATVADRTLEAALEPFLQEGAAPRTQHYIAER